MKSTKSLKLARGFLGKEVEVVIDRPMGSKHPKYGFIYESNYGYVPGTRVPDGGELDAYFLGVDQPVKKGKGKCVAIIHRLENDDDRIIVVVKDLEKISDQEIVSLVHFQEQYAEFEILRE